MLPSGASASGSSSEPKKKKKRAPPDSLEAAMRAGSKKHQKLREFAAQNATKNVSGPHPFANFIRAVG